MLRSRQPWYVFLVNVGKILLQKLANIVCITV